MTLVLRYSDGFDLHSIKNKIRKYLSRKLNNAISKDFQRMLFPLNLLQMVLLQPKYRIIRGYIFPNSFVYQGVCVLGVSFVIFIIIINQVMSSSMYKELLSQIFKLQTVLYTAYSVIIFIWSVAYRNRFVCIILKIQKAYEVFKCRDYVQQCRNSTWIYTSSNLFLVVCYLTGQYALHFWIIPYILFRMVMVYFDANIIYVIQMIKILVHGLKLWRVELDRFLVTCSKTDYAPLRKYLNDVSRQKERLLTAYSDILRAYELSEKVFHLPIMVQAATIVVQSLMFVQVYINVSSVYGSFYLFQLRAIIAILLISLLEIKNYALLICACVTYQRFRLGIAEVEAGCAILRSKHGCLAEVRRLCKNVSRLNAHARGGCAWGVLAVDAALPLRLLILLATYSVVLLQFALL